MDMLRYKNQKKKPKKSNKSGAFFFKDGDIVDSPKRKYLTWEPDRKVWEEKIANIEKGYVAYKRKVNDKYKSLIEERQRKIRENMNKIEPI